MSCPQIWNTEKEKEREKEEIGDIGPAKLNEKKSDGELDWRGSEEHVRHFLHKTCNQEVSGRFTL